MILYQGLQAQRVIKINGLLLDASCEEIIPETTHSTLSQTLVYFSFQVCTNTMGRYTGKKCRLLTMLWLTALFFLVEIVVGYVTNSMALIADSFHMLSDVAALVVAFLSVKVSSTLILNFMLNSSVVRISNIFVTLLITYEQFLCYRCHRRNGPRTPLAGPGQRC